MCHSGKTYKEHNLQKLDCIVVGSCLRGWTTGRAESGQRRNMALRLFRGTPRRIAAGGHGKIIDETISMFRAGALTSLCF